MPPGASVQRHSAKLVDRHPEVALQCFAHGCVHPSLVKYRQATSSGNFLYSAATRAIGLFGCVVQLA